MTLNKGQVQSIDLQSLIEYSTREFEVACEQYQFRTSSSSWTSSLCLLSFDYIYVYNMFAMLCLCLLFGYFIIGFYDVVFMKVVFQKDIVCGYVDYYYKFANIRLIHKVRKFYQVFHNTISMKKNKCMHFACESDHRRHRHGGSFRRHHHYIYCIRIT